MYCIKDSHHRVPKEWAKEINAAGKGLTLDDLLNELNLMETQKYLTRSSRGKQYLRRFFYKLDDIGTKFEVEEAKTSVKMNLRDVVKAFYHSKTDNLYLSNIRCSCRECIVNNFLQCKTITPQNIFSFNMSKIQVKKQFPDGDPIIDAISSEMPSVDINDSVLPPNPVLDTDAHLEKNDENVNRFITDDPRSKDSPILVASSVESSEIQNGVKRYELPTVEFKLDCILSPTELKDARRMISRGSRTDPPDWTVLGFKNQEEYRTGHFDSIVNKFNRFKVTDQTTDVQQIKIMNSMCLNELIKRRLADSDKDFNEILEAYISESPNGLPEEQFSFMLLAIFSSTGLKHIIETEERFRYEHVPTQGHFACAKFDLIGSELTYFDTAGSGKLSIDRSIYISYDTISRIFTEVHDALRRIYGLDRQKLTVSYQLNNGQEGLNCGPQRQG